MKDFPPFSRPRHAAMPPPVPASEAKPAAGTDPADLRATIAALEQKRREIVAEIAKLRRRLREASAK